MLNIAMHLSLKDNLEIQIINMITSPDFAYSAQSISGLASCIFFAFAHIN